MIDFQLILESAVSTSPCIHFLLYIPSLTHTPLQIRYSDDTILATNAFLIPQWGGIVINNVNRNSGHKSLILQRQELHAVMQIFAQQLRELMGVVPLKFSSNVSRVEIVILK